MGLFKKKAPRVVRKGSAGVERSVKKVNGQEFTIVKPAKQPKASAGTATKKRQGALHPAVH